ncbi:MAG: pyruvate dehydrogenase (acetyl-transferring), homodimeric type, partial [Burkholderiales bacterium]|nr:pyruvate dehydrogenase (acetyl-transferring), homodimeric type [Burkholderiales bacterium]
TDEQIDRLKRGGHDLVKIHAAYAAAAAHKGQPTVILAHTKKGYGMGTSGQGKMTTHSQKKLDGADLIGFRNRFNLPLTDEQATGLAFYKPAEDSAEMQYLRSHRQQLGGYLPRRETACEALPVPPIASYAQFALQAAGKEMSTTMAFVRMLTGLLKDATLGPRIVPIVADEARTFGMANLFKQVGIYSFNGQVYEPEDIGSVLSYREATDGQILEEGISEAGAISSWTAAATSHAVHGLAMLPFYIYYSMFGFQRIGDLIWAAADQRSRGFLLGATAGRTTLGGEGLQHQDGSSVLQASTVPNCRVYEPCFAAELAVILHHGAQRMLEQQHDEFYYIALMNENYPQPSLPDARHEDVIRGMYRVAVHAPASSAAARGRVRLLGSGAILREVMAAAELLAADWQLEAEVWSVTSYSELEREARALRRHQRLHPEEPPRLSHLQRCLGGSDPVVAASDYVRAWPGLIAPYLEAPYEVLGTDGFGRSDTRAALRDFFEVDRSHIVLAALTALRGQGRVEAGECAEALRRFGFDPERSASWLC